MMSDLIGTLDWLPGSKGQHGGHMAVPQQQQPALDDHVFLIGRPPVGEFLGFVQVMAHGGHAANQGALLGEWRTANAHLVTLQQRERGAADNPTIQALPPALFPLRDRLTANPSFQRAYQYMPTSFGIVELDRLVVFQKHINLAYVARLKETLGATPTEEEVFRFLLDADRPRPPVRTRQTANNAYTFLSPSDDFRFIEARPLDPAQIAQIQGYVPQGPVSGAVALVVGYGMNVFNAALVENRLILGNGSHRAYALRDRGITHAPCVIQQVSTRDELEILGFGDLHEHADNYLSSPRPPMLKDYFDPDLRKIIQVPRKNRLVQVSFGIQQADVPDG